jgi:enolase
MNRAAEKAAPAAKQIFWDAVGEMTFDDARKILSGSDTAATEYFKGKTTNKLTAAFKPVVNKSMNEVGVTRQYKELVGRYESIPFVKKESFDLDQYVVTKALDGLFHMVGEEEKKIRKNPTARTTDLLKEVFGSK